MSKYSKFDRALDDLRNDVAKAVCTMMDAGKRYVAMLDALDSAFCLHYEHLPEADRVNMMAAFYRLQNTVGIFKAKREQRQPPDNVHMFKDVP
jgi:hypothetical protein